jgi:SAM-dependent methyltransferase
MEPRSREARRKTFDEVADVYERARPGYPEALVDDVIALSGLPPRGSILEIGTGTGKATVAFARRGYRILGLEPGPRLAAIARRALAPFPGVTVEVCRFEDWSPAPEPVSAVPPRATAFDLVMAAQSFHFVDPAVGLGKAGAMLRPGGAVAIFGNEPLAGESTAHQRIQAAYARHAPELVRRFVERENEPSIEREVAATGLFEPAVAREYAWRQAYSATGYADLMSTQSDHRLLPADRRDALLQAIRAAIDAAGGTIEIAYRTSLGVARRRVVP